MESGQPTRMESEPESQAATLGASTGLSPSENMDGAGSKSSAEPTAATTRKDSHRILTSARLAELQSKAGLVAGALADFQTAGGIVAAEEVEYAMLSGKKCKAVRVFLIVPDYSLVVVKTEDGLDFELVAVE